MWGGGGGFQLFPIGVQMLIPIETYRTFDFPGGPVPYLPSRSAHEDIGRRFSL